MSDIQFDGRVAIVTGAGGGLGKTYALDLGKRGAQVVVNDLGGAADGTGSGTNMADEVVKEITEAGGKAVANYDSVSTPEGGEAIVKTALDSFGKVDVVINNAGILRDKTFAKLAPEDLEIVLDVHLKGAFFVSQPAFKVMKENGYGRLIFTASAAGIFGNFGQTNYGAAKMGLVGLSNVLAQEGAKYNIKINALAPTAGTRMTEGLLPDEAFDLLTPETVTPAVLFLVSEDAPTRTILGAGAGSFAVSRIVECPGKWLPPEEQTPEGIAANWDAISATEGENQPGAGAEQTVKKNGHAMEGLGLS